MFNDKMLIAQTVAHLLDFHFTTNHPVGEPVGTVLK